LRLIRYCSVNSDGLAVTLLPQILATRSIIGAAMRPLNLTEQAEFSHPRSEAGQAWRLVLR
jgi:hypothetical protein